MSHRQRPSRRTVLQTLGALGTATGVASAVAGAQTGADERQPADTAAHSTGATADDVPEGATQYVAVVDRIVDGQHVVLLLEKDGELVDQHVEPKATFDEIEERDILQVVLKDGSLLSYTHLSERPGSSVRDARDRSLTDLAANTPSNATEQN
ncbi:hypothetical protein [Natronorubrum bangense]|nr:hypothetical protein [Natronorubrum bangense]ELY51045.1 hypothetical protein C494_04201 [Natronorubrum bangense JCM 10635]